MKSPVLKKIDRRPEPRPAIVYEELNAYKTLCRLWQGFCRE